MTASKSQVIEQVSELTGVPSGQVRTVVDAFLNEVARRVASGETVSLRGFGDFLPTATARAPHAVDPATGKETKPRKGPSFKPGKSLAT